MTTERGFTLAELLISLAILGIIATFTIPKIIVSQQNGKYNASAKEAASMIAGAYIAYSQNNVSTANTSAGALTPYMNYVAADLSSNFDGYYGTSASRSCGTYPCLRLHNGGLLSYATAGFTGTNTNNAIYFYYDPDGIVTDSTTNGPGKSVVFWLYFNGRMTSYSNILPGTVYGGGTVNPNLTADPPWFSW